MSDRSIYWSVTINNPKPDDEENISFARGRGWDVEGQIERGDNGTPHYQLFVNCRAQQRFSALKKMFPRGHIEAARNPKALKQYVHKSETRLAELPNSERYVTSVTRFWQLISDELTDPDIDKRHRVYGDTLEAYDDKLFDPLKALNYATDRLLRKGYYCVETMAVNPQNRSSFKEFWQGLMVRRELDRQTDRQAEIISRVDVTTNNSDEDEDSEEQAPRDGQEQTQSDDTSRCGSEELSDSDQGSGYGYGSSQDSEASTR